MIAVATIVAFTLGFGYVQKLGLFTSAEDESTETLAADDDTEYVCPMLCVPPTKQPGRCPVCAMELQARKPTGNAKDIYGLTIAPAARRLANIRTVVAAKAPLSKKITTLGRISVDETSQATISAYVDGRLEKMLVAYTGAEVKMGQPLAIIYSPELYAAQVELLEAKRLSTQNTSDRDWVIDSNQRLYESSRQRLIELGLPESKLEEIEQTGKADTRIQLVSPINGTVTEKLGVEGQYVKTGSPILKVVDLSTIWLLLELFPEDASLIRYGQPVSVTLPSQSGRQFQGRVAFVDPQIDPATQTVPVRIVISNEAGLLSIGDYAQATIETKVTPTGELLNQLYDAELADKWISPKHPYIVRDQPGNCPESGEALVPAAEFGYVSHPIQQQGAIVVPRNAVLMAAGHSVAYVETEPGRFEFRSVEVGQIVGDQVAIISGIQAGENVVADAPYTLDSAFNMAGKPSLIDPTKSINKDETLAEPSRDQIASIQQAISQLSLPDQKLAAAQISCPVTGFAIGSMGKPIKVSLENRDLFICCEGCREQLLADPEKYFAILDAPAPDDLSPEEADQIAAALSQLSAADQELAKKQIYCPVAEQRLGSMGTPLKVDVNGQAVFICCDGCREMLLKDPESYFAKIEELKSQGKAAKTDTR